MSATMQTASGRRNQRLALVSRIVRWVTLGSFLAFVLAATALHTLGYVAPSIHAICPYGGLESMLSLVAVGTFLKKIVIGTFVLFGTTVALALVLRRSFCGQLCAFGGLQEFFGKLGAKLFKKRPVMPKKLDKVLRYLKYVVLAVTVAMAWITGELWITPYDPFNALGHLADFNALITSYLIGFIVLVLTLLGSLVYDRFFCKYLCPAGALYGLIGQASPYAVRVDAKTCIHCGKCSRACPMNIDVMNAKNGRVSSPECINCNECVNVCPVEGAIHTGFPRRRTFTRWLPRCLRSCCSLRPWASPRQRETCSCCRTSMKAQPGAHPPEKWKPAAKAAVPKKEPPRKRKKTTPRSTATRRATCAARTHSLKRQICSVFRWKHSTLSLACTVITLPAQRSRMPRRIWGWVSATSSTSCSINLARHKNKAPEKSGAFVRYPAFLLTQAASSQTRTPCVFRRSQRRTVRHAGREYS